MSREFSIADWFIYVANEVRKIDEDVTNETQHSYPLRKMRATADKIIYDALMQAKDIAESAKIIKKEIADKQE